MKTQQAPRPAATTDLAWKGLAVFQLVALVGLGILAFTQSEGSPDEDPGRAPAQHAERLILEEHEPMQEAARESQRHDEQGSPPPTIAQAEPVSKDSSNVEAKQESAEKPSAKRLVLASTIENREPVPLTEATVGRPVTAFVEMDNPAAHPVSIEIVFEHESGLRVGFIELEIPEDTPRYRTWGRSRQIRKPGTWTAIVTHAGQEISRQSFQVAPRADSAVETAQRGLPQLESGAQPDSSHTKRGDIDAG